MKLALASMLISCAASPTAPIANRAHEEAPRPEPMLGERGLRVPIDKAAIEAMLVGSIANVTEESTVVQLPGAPQTKLVPKSVPAGIAMLILERGTEIHVFAREVTMSHGLEVGMSVADAKVKYPDLKCASYLADVTCRIPAFPRFAFRIYDDHIDEPRIDHVIWLRTDH